MILLENSFGALNHLNKNEISKATSRESRLLKTSFWSNASKCEN